MSGLEEALRTALGCRELEATGDVGGGCVCEGGGYTADGRKIYVKFSQHDNARSMFIGEMEGLLALERTGCVRVPHPEQIVEYPDKKGAMLVMEFLDIADGGRAAGKELGEKIAKMHLHNLSLESSGCADYVSRFGFPVNTCCGRIEQNNAWTDTWLEFFTRKLDDQLSRLKPSSAGEALDLWARLKPKMGSFFSGLDVKPSLLHGDLWSGNVGQIHREAVIFDPGAFFGHHEYDLGIATVFGVPPGFFAAYHNIIPKAPGFDQRNQLYQLFHYLNHWNHFGSSYKSQSLNIMRRLI